VVRARYDVELGRNAGVDQAPRIFDIFVDEQIDRSNADECRRKPCEILQACRHRACRHFRRSRRDTEQRSPAKNIGVGDPKKLANVRRDAAAAAGAVVKDK